MTIYNCKTAHQKSSCAQCGLVKLERFYYFCWRVFPAIAGRIFPHVASGNATLGTLHDGKRHSPIPPSRSNVAAIVGDVVDGTASDVGKLIL